MSTAEPFLPRDTSKILVVDDEPDVVELLEFKLKASGYEVRTLTQPLKFLATLRDFKPDLLILDIMMPDLDGIQLCRIVRADPEMDGIPIIFLSAKGEAADRIEGLESGADDYIAKPFNAKELILRVKRTLDRRLPTTPIQATKSIITISGVVIDKDQHQLTVDGKPILLTATEFRLLQVLMERKGRVQTRDHLLSTVWKYESEIETRTVDTHIRRVRDKLGAYASMIETVRGVGYRAVEVRATK